MRSRLVILIVLVIAAAAVVVAVHRFARPSPGSGTLPPDLASYLGVYETGPPRTYQPVAAFTSAVGRQPNLVGYYNGTTRPRSCNGIPPSLRSQGLPPAAMTVICARLRTASATSASRSLSASATR
jgi:hypothetical protein